jgi:hypothetical protein
LLLFPILCLLELAEMMHGVDGAAVARQSSVSKVEDLLVSLNGHRSGRVATTLQRFPIIHWSVLIVLYSIIVLSFLLDSNQEINQYLNSGEVRKKRGLFRASDGK